MDLVQRAGRKSLILLIPLSAASYFIDWSGPPLNAVGKFGNPDFIAASILIGGLLGIVNLNVMHWSLERLLSSHRASGKLVFASMFRLFLLFAAIILLAGMGLVNLLGLTAGITVVFVVLIAEAIRMARNAPRE